MSTNQLIGHARTRHLGEFDWWECGEGDCNYHAKEYAKMAAHRLESGHMAEGKSAQKLLEEIVRVSPKIATACRSAANRNEEKELKRKKTTDDNGKARNTPKALPMRAKISTDSRVPIGPRAEAEPKRRKPMTNEDHPKAPDRSKAVRYRVRYTQFGPKLPLFMPVHRFLVKEEEEEDAEERQMPKEDGQRKVAKVKGKKVIGGEARKRRVMPMGEKSKAVAKKRGRPSQPMHKGVFTAQCRLCWKTLHCKCQNNRMGVIIHHMYGCHSPLDHWKCSRCATAMRTKSNMQQHIRRIHNRDGQPKWAVKDSARFKQEMEEKSERCFPGMGLGRSDWTATAY